MRPPRLLLLLALTPALAAPEPLAPPEHQERRGVTVITSSGELPPGAAGPLLARLRRGDRTACETPVTPAGGRVQVELLVSGRLLPGRYGLEVVPEEGGEPLLAGELRIGSEADARSAEENQRAWLDAAASTLRGLSAALDLHGRFRARLSAERDREGAADEALELRTFLDETWWPALRVAAMDLLTARRRVVLAPRPEAFAALGAVVDALAARGRAWEEAAGGSKVVAPPDGDLEARVAALLAALGHADAEARLAGWRAGPLAEPAPAPGELARGGVHEDPLGWRLEVPAGLQPEPQRQPNDRLTLSRLGCKVVVQVRELPDARDAAALTTAIETLNWETLPGYKPLRTEPLPEGRGVRIELTADFGRLGESSLTGRMVQRTLFPPGGGRAIVLQVGWVPQDAPPPPELAALEAGFALREP